MDENISTAALMGGLSSAWLHLSLPPFPASIQQSKAVEILSSGPGGIVGFCFLHRCRINNLAVVQEDLVSIHNSLKK